MDRKPQPNSIQNTGASRTVWLPQYISVRLFRLSARLRRKMSNVGEVASYVSWMTEVFGDVAALPTREKALELMAQRLSQRQVRWIEFGVAFGYGTDWWLKRLPGAEMRWTASIDLPDFQEHGGPWTLALSTLRVEFLRLMTRE